MFRKVSGRSVMITFCVTDIIDFLEISIGVASSTMYYCAPVATGRRMRDEYRSQRRAPEVRETAEGLQVSHHKSKNTHGRSVPVWRNDIPPLL